MPLRSVPLNPDFDAADKLRLVTAVSRVEIASRFHALSPSNLRNQPIIAQFRISALSLLEAIIQTEVPYEGTGPALVANTRTCTDNLRPCLRRTTDLGSTRMWVVAGGSRPPAPRGPRCPFAPPRPAPSSRVGPAAAGTAARQAPAGSARASSHNSTAEHLPLRRSQCARPSRPWRRVDLVAEWRGVGVERGIPRARRLHRPRRCSVCVRAGVTRVGRRPLRLG
jgi:hypothetical protein